MEYNVDENGYYGTFGGAYIPEILYANAETLRNNYLNIISKEGFQKELDTLMRDYVGRPSPLYYARRLSEKYGAKIYLKREDLNHTGAHKINNTLGQILLARRMGKTRIIAETGAGQHGVATATVCAMLGLKCRIYMGQIDARRQALNVARMRMLGAEVVEVTLGDRILKDAINDIVQNQFQKVFRYDLLAGYSAEDEAEEQALFDGELLHGGGPPFRAGCPMNYFTV